jgi:hypothetical protein
VAPHAPFKEAIFFIKKKTLKRGTPTTSPEKQNSKQPIYNFLSYPREHTTTENGIEGFTRKWQQNETYTRRILIQEAHGKAKQKQKQSNALKEKVMFRGTFYKQPRTIPTHTSLYKPSTTKKNN